MAILEIDPLEGTRDKSPIDMSLRLWSNDNPLESLVNQTRLALDQLHIRDQPIQVGGAITDRIATRHYASIGSATGRKSSDIDAWLALIIRLLENQDITLLIQSGKIQALSWIAVFDEEMSDSLNIGRANIDALKNYKIDLMIEDYTKSDADGAPLRRFIRVD